MGEAALNSNVNHAAGNSSVDETSVNGSIGKEAVNSFAGEVAMNDGVGAAAMNGSVGTATVNHSVHKNPDVNDAEISADRGEKETSDKEIETKEIDNKSEAETSGKECKGKTSVNESNGETSDDENEGEIGGNKSETGITGQVTFQCKQCKWLFNSVASLQRHNKSHRAAKPFKCRECPKQFISKSGLENHRRQHTGERPFECDTCGKTFASRSVLVMHTRGHTGEKPYVCQVCGKGYTQSASLADHKRTHTGHKPYQCDICHKRYTTKAGYRVHIETHSNDVTNNYECTVCKKVFTHMRKLKSHEKVHSKNLECAECSKKFYSKTTLREHILADHTEERAFHCTINACDMKFPSQVSLKNHLRYAHTKRACERCGIKLQYEKKKRHERNNCWKIKPKKFHSSLCLRCGQQFYCKRSLKKHKLKCEQHDSLIPSFFCDFCKLECSTYDSHLSHLLTHIDINTPAFTGRIHKVYLAKETGTNPAIIIRDVLITSKVNASKVYTRIQRSNKDYLSYTTCNITDTNKCLHDGDIQSNGSNIQSDDVNKEQVSDRKPRNPTPKLSHLNLCTKHDGQSSGPSQLDYSNLTTYQAIVNPGHKANDSPMLVVEGDSLSANVVKSISDAKILVGGTDKDLSLQCISEGHHDGMVKKYKNSQKAEREGNSYCHQQAAIINEPSYNERSLNLTENKNLESSKMSESIIQQAIPTNTMTPQNTFHILQNTEKIRPYSQSSSLQLLDTSYNQPDPHNLHIIHQTAIQNLGYSNDHHRQTPICQLSGPYSASNTTDSNMYQTLSKLVLLNGNWDGTTVIQTTDGRHALMTKQTLGGWGHLATTEEYIGQGRTPVMQQPISVTNPDASPVPGNTNQTCTGDAHVSGQWHHPVSQKGNAMYIPDAENYCEIGMEISKNQDSFKHANKTEMTNNELKKAKTPEETGIKYHSGIMHQDIAQMRGYNHEMGRGSMSNGCGKEALTSVSGSDRQGVKEKSREVMERNYPLIGVQEEVGVKEEVVWEERSWSHSCHMSQEGQHLTGIDNDCQIISETLEDSHIFKHSIGIEMNNSDDVWSKTPEGTGIKQGTSVTNNSSSLYQMLAQGKELEPEHMRSLASCSGKEVVTSMAMTSHQSVEGRRGRDGVMMRHYPLIREQEEVGLKEEIMWEERPWSHFCHMPQEEGHFHCLTDTSVVTLDGALNLKVKQDAEEFM